LNDILLKLRNRFLYHLASKNAINGINNQEEWDEAGYDSILFHAIMKWPLREIVRILPDIPQAWIDNLTGSRKLLYQIAKKEWYNNDDNSQRRAKLWKPFLYFLILWQNDETMEPADKLLYEVLKHRDEFYINLNRQDPANWYMDTNPAMKQHGRVLGLFSEDPEIRYNTVNQPFGYDLITTFPQPTRNFICIRNPDGSPGYLIIDRFSYSLEEDGGFTYHVMGNMTDQISAAMLAAKVEKERKW